MAEKTLQDIYNLLEMLYDYLRSRDFTGRETDEPFNPKSIVSRRMRRVFYKGKKSQLQWRKECEKRDRQARKREKRRVWFEKQLGIQENPSIQAREEWNKFQASVEGQAEDEYFKKVKADFSKESKRVTFFHIRCKVYLYKLRRIIDKMAEMRRRWKSRRRMDKIEKRMRHIHRTLNEMKESRRRREAA